MNVRARGEAARKFILSNVARHPRDIARFTAESLGISRQAVHGHLRNLVSEGALVSSGRTSDRRYELPSEADWQDRFPLAGLEEDQLWRTVWEGPLSGLPANVRQIWYFAFTEMVNNAIDHSNGQHVLVRVQRNAADTSMVILDDGVGIFAKIQQALGLADPRLAVLELAKGKFTTDPSRHTGEGIFFSSRMFDRFAILSGRVAFSHAHGDDADWISELTADAAGGTGVHMTLDNHTSRTAQEIIGQFSTDEELCFDKTIVPVRMAQYGDENLISRSQAKRLMARVDRFKCVILDFDGVAEIGPAFADEIFRVFANQHPEMELLTINANPAVDTMVRRALQARASGK